MLEALAAIASTISAMCAVLDLGVRRPNGSLVYPDILHAPVVNATLDQLAASNTYELRELEAIRARLDGCYDHFVSEGGGEQRRTCLCSVVNDVVRGNGGVIPIDDWAQRYEQLNCTN